MAQETTIMCAADDTKQTMLDRGLNTQDKRIVLHEAGEGTRKVTIEDYPLNTENHIFLEELSKYGTATDIRNEHLRLGNTKTRWLLGPRHSYIRDMKDCIAFI